MCGGGGGGDLADVVGRAAGGGQFRLRGRGDHRRGLEVAPDADAVIADTDGFRMVDCERCGGMLKPD